LLNLQDLSELELFLNGKTRGPAARLRSMVDRGRRGQEVWRRFTGARRASARGHRFSSALAGEDEEDEAEPEAGSPEHERQKSHVAWVLERGGEL
jgi:hypothetical protein